MSLFQTLLMSVLGIFVMMLPGFIARKRNWLDSVQLTALSRLHVIFIYPCLIFSSIVSKFTLGGLLREWVMPVGSAGIMILGGLIGLLAVWKLKFSKTSQRPAFLFQCTMNNYSFLPLVMVVTLYGGQSKAEGLLLFSTLGAEAVAWTLGIFFLNGGKLEKRSLLHLFSPPLLGMYAAVGVLAVVHIFGVDKAVFERSGTLPNFVLSTTRMLGAATIPLAMIIAGARLAVIRREELRGMLVWIITALRLVGIPLAAAGLLLLLPMDDVSRNVLLIVAVMPTSLASMMLSQLYGSDRVLTDGSVLLSHVLGLLTIPLLLAWLL